MREQKNKNILEELKQNEEVFLNYLKSRFPFFHNANFFMRDLEYGIKMYLEKKDTRISASENLFLAESMADYFEQKGYLKNIRENVWTVKIPQYVTTKPGDPF